MMAGTRFRECLVGEQVLSHAGIRPGKKVQSWKEVAQPQMQGGEVFWKRYIDHIKPLTFCIIIIASSDTITSRSTGKPFPYLLGVADVPPVYTTNPGQDTTDY